VVHQNVRLSEAIVTDILDSDHLPIVFTILGPAGAREDSDSVEMFTCWVRFQSLAHDFISPSVHFHSSAESNQAAGDFAASIATADRLAIRTAMILDRKYELSGLNRLLKYKTELRKLW
jgi:hypothetical protein